MASPSPNRSIMGVAKRLLELAELAARRARARLASRERAFLGGCLGGSDRPADARRARLGIEIDRKAFAPERRDDPADLRHLGGAFVFAAGRERLVDRVLLGRLVDGAADRKAVLGEIPGGPDGERALGACRGCHPVSGRRQDGARQNGPHQAAHSDAPALTRAAFARPGRSPAPTLLAISWCTFRMRPTSGSRDVAMPACGCQARTGTAHSRAPTASSTSA